MHITPCSLAAGFAAMQRKIGPEAYVGIVINGTHGASSVTIHPTGLLGRSGTIYVKLEPDAAFEDLLPALEAAWLEHGATHRANMTHRLALAIIEITADRGDCPDYVLRMKFSDQDVTLYGEEAEAEANAIAGKGPFSISRSTGSNHAPRVDMVA